jgi:TonB family protein
MRPTALTLLLVGCLTAVQATMAQEISARLQRRLDEATACRVNDDFACARAALESISTQGLSSFEQYRYWIAAGYVEFLEGNFPGAIDAYRNAATHSPNREVRQYHLRSIAQMQASMGRFREAYDTLEELVVVGGDFPLTERHLTNDALWRGFDIYLIGDRDLFPLGREQPEFPAAAVEQGLSQGYVNVELTVTRTGSTRDVRVIDSSAPAFESAAIQAAESFKYKPRVVDGEPVETVVRERVEFQSNP